MSRTFQFLLLVVLAGIVWADAASSNVPDGPHSCGGVEVPYPFGIIDQDGNGDFRQQFGIACVGGKPVYDSDNTTLTNITATTTIAGHAAPIPIGDFSLDTAEARMWIPVMWQCYDSTGNTSGSSRTVLHLHNTSAFRISNAKNSLFVLGCSTIGYLRGKSHPAPLPGSPNRIVYTQLTGCIGYCDDDQSAVNGVCSGVGCCHADIPPDLGGNSIRFKPVTGIMDRADSLNFSPCDYAFLAEKDSYTFNTTDLNMPHLDQNPRLMPVTIDWAIRDSATCEEAMTNKTNYACISSNSRCLNATNGPGYICNCANGYEGNPYTADGCTDINECEHLDNYPCQGNCVNKQGSYDCICPKYSRSTDAKTKPCEQIFPLRWRLITGSFVVFLIAAIMVFVFLLKIQKRKMQDNFKKNGGPTLEKLRNMKLYKKEDIRKIQKSCNIIGQGGFGKVYKGCIGNDTEPVAVKEPINVNSVHNGQFANEISIQSQVIHKNIVKLLGCCLEVDSPILVYEFVPKGSLDDILHGASSKALSMGLRLQIAAGSAEGLAYMHSKANATILHGDVKPANILINDDFTPKISDFGISRLMAADKEHTRHVIGDMSYMDPVFLQTGLLTSKSDVYSFGVVLLELITRKKASHSNQNELLRKFVEAYKKEKSLIELVDKELLEVDPQLLNRWTEMIHECLCLDVEKRPDMTDVEERLRDMVKRFPSTE